MVCEGEWGGKGVGHAQIKVKMAINDMNIKHAKFNLNSTLAVIRALAPQVLFTFYL